MIGVVQHTDDCPPALLGEWLTQAGATLDVRRPAVGDALPSLEDHDAVVVLGGPMGAYDDEHRWLGPTRQLVRDAAAAGVPVLGVCLGHQLAAVALGGRVVVDPRGQQLGVLAIGWTPAAGSDALVGPLVEGSRVGVHWNHDVVVELPPGAEVLAVAPGGEVQAARLAPTVWGLQWHPEADLSVVTAWAGHDRIEHEQLGVDQAAVLDAVDAARPELDEAWRPLAAAFVRCARVRRVERADSPVHAGSSRPPS